MDYPGKHCFGIRKESDGMDDQNSLSRDDLVNYMLVTKAGKQHDLERWVAHVPGTCTETRRISENNCWWPMCHRRVTVLLTLITWKLEKVLISIQSQCFIFVTFLGKTPSVCQQKRKDAMKLPAIGRFLPTCKADGSFDEMQCHGSTGQCWCVDSNGFEWAGTRLRAPKQPSCNESGLYKWIVQNS